MTPVDLSELRVVFDNMEGRVKYKFGAKAPNLDCDSHAIDKIDCSGFVQYAIGRATCGAIYMPDGSVNQHDWCEDEVHDLRRLTYYRDLRYAAADPTRLFIAFIAPTKDHAGHVWLVTGGQTMESRSGAGVSSRRWNSPTLMRACAAYELPAKG